MSLEQFSYNVDDNDLKIIDLMLHGYSNLEISNRLDKPVSTIQRRTRKIQQNGIVTTKTQLNYKLLGFKAGLVHVYLSDGNIDEIADKVYSLNGITSVEIHIGNSDILGNVIYKEGKGLLNTIAAIKKMKGVKQVIWSERVHQSPVKVHTAALKDIF